MNLESIAKLFGSNKNPLLLPGGQGITHRSGNIILKPIEDKKESEELAEMISKMTSSKNLCIPQPIKSIRGNWVEENYVAWEFLKGQELKSKYKEKIEVCELFSKFFENTKKPAFIESRNNPWSTADKVSWGEINKQYDAEFQKIIDDVIDKLKPIKLKNQIVHGDIAGNILFDEDCSSVIDLTIYWRPKDFTKALLIVDAITWEGADVGIYELVKDLPEINQLILRAGLRRIIENPEHVMHSGKERSEGIKEAILYFDTLRLLSLV